jgi:hypothetical protein
VKTPITTLVCIFTVAVAFLSCDFGTNNENMQNNSSMQSNSSSSSKPQCDGTDLSLYGFGRPCGCVLPTITPTLPPEEQCGNNKYMPISGYIRCENDIIEAKCGDEWYNTETQFCYEHSVFDKCDGEIYYPPDEICENFSAKYPSLSK